MTTTAQARAFQRFNGLQLRSQMPQWVEYRDCNPRGLGFELRRRSCERLVVFHLLRVDITDTLIMACNRVIVDGIYQAIFDRKKNPRTSVCPILSLILKGPLSLKNDCYTPDKLNLGHFYTGSPSEP